MIQLEGLSKSYGPRVGVAGLSLRVARGSVFGFIGPNGAGKTTAIRLLLGFLRPDTGSARVLGLDCWRQSHLVKQRVGYVPGDLRLHGWMHAGDALRFVGRARGMDLLGPGLELASRFELETTVRVRSMSRGMRQKLGLILALVSEPDLLVLDEPTTALDPLTQGRLYEHLRALARRGHTVFFSSHVLSEVQDLCDHVAIVRGGRLVANEALETLRRRAGRSVTICWNETPPVPPDFLELRGSVDGVWKCGLDAAVPELLAWLHGRAIRDLEIGPPDLDSLFVRYYEQEGDQE